MGLFNESRTFGYSEHLVLSLLIERAKNVPRPDGFAGDFINRKYRNLTKTSPATEQRDISDLFDKKIIQQNPGHDRRVSYDLVWH